jgi:hypothetical protein
MQPDDFQSKIQYLNEMNRISIKKNENPVRLLEQISEIQVRYGHYAATDSEIFSYVSSALPSEYQSIVVTISCRSDYRQASSSIPAGIPAGAAVAPRALQQDSG